MIGHPQRGGELITCDATVTAALPVGRFSCDAPTAAVFDVSAERQDAALPRFDRPW